MQDYEFLRVRIKWLWTMSTKTISQDKLFASTSNENSKNLKCSEILLEKETFLEGNFVISNV